MCYLMNSTSKKMQQVTGNGSNRFDARNNAQVYLARDLTCIFRILCIQKYQTPTHTAQCSQHTTADSRVGLSNLWFGKETGDILCRSFCWSNTLQNSFVDVVQSGLLRLCGELKDSSVAAVDAFVCKICKTNSCPIHVQWKELHGGRTYACRSQNPRKKSFDDRL